MAYVRTADTSLPAEIRALLDTIAGSEATGYNVTYGGRTFSDFAQHPGIYETIQSGPNAGKKSSAAGRYQFLERSWREAQKSLGLPDFSPANQDKAAAWEANRAYKAKTGRALIDDIKAAGGDPGKLTAIGSVLSSWWTSLPGGIEPNKATGGFGKRFADNLAYYAGNTNNAPAAPPGVPGGDVAAMTQAAQPGMAVTAPMGLNLGDVSNQQRNQTNALAGILNSLANNPQLDLPQFSPLPVRLSPQQAIDISGLRRLSDKYRV